MKRNLSQKKNLGLLKKKKQQEQQPDEKTKSPSVNEDAGDELNLGGDSSRPKTALQQAFLARLAGSRFRELNEDLYTTNSSSAFERFQKNPELFDQYHEGFRTQVMSWPINPVDVVYKWILSVNRSRPKEEQKSSKLTIADFGCGDAKLAEKLLKIKAPGSGKSRARKRRKKQKENASDEKNKNEESSSDDSSSYAFKVHSFDLVANGNPNIQPCDMSNVPLEDGTVDIGVFVLALMGTNIADFIREAHRVLTPDGKLKIAEVRSRFESGTMEESNKDANKSSSKKGGRDQKNKGKNSKFTYSSKRSDDSLLKEFLDVMQDLGFRCTKKDRGNKMFILLEFEKTGKSPSKDAAFTAKPCIYKRR
mmetsp:Transcript_5510/g.6372  ORF Transcript_5510/g.6372 Transcript_5510/m.6372 type:complete len:364 (-) Transcript_5510:42-1133(-)